MNTPTAREKLRQLADDFASSSSEPTDESFERCVLLHWILDYDYYYYSTFSTHYNTTHRYNSMSSNYSLHIHTYTHIHTPYQPIHLYIYTPINLYSIHLHTYTPIYLYTYTHIHLYTYIPIHLHTCTPYTYIPVITLTDILRCART